MEIATLTRFIYITSDRTKYNQFKRGQFFFTPMEELNGSNIFSKLSNNYKVIQPYLEMIDTDFIQNMNKNVKNIALYVNPKRDLISESYML